jgi:endo-1,4-beta-mannosidase
MPLYGGPAEREEIVAWARLVVQAVRAAGATQPISLGDGAWGVETTGRSNGYSLRALAPLVDFVGPHVYPMADDEVRQHLTAAFTCELCDGFGLPVVLEEFGVSSDFAGEAEAAAYYRHVLHTTLLAGARGWLAWNNCDFDDLRHHDPYRHHVFELHFGLTDGEGRPKATLRELERFSHLLRGLPAGWEAVRGDAALLVPEHFERELPFTEPAYREDIRASLLQAYVAAREADLPVRLVRERDGAPGDATLLLVPSTKLLTAGGIERIRDVAGSGSLVYASYFAGSTPNQRGPWLTYLDEIFGIEHRLRYGLVDPIEDETVVLHFVEPLGELDAGTRLEFAVAGTPSARSYLPVEPAGARVVAVDGHGRPALLRHGLGAGSTVFCTYPLEHMAARTPRVNPEDTWRLYSALATEAGVERRVRVADPRVLVGLVRGAGRELAILVNCSGDAVVAKLLTAGGAELEPAASTLALDPLAVVSLPVHGARSAGPAPTPVVAAEGRDARS